MDFLIHLGMLFLGLLGLVFFIAWPKSTVFWGSVLATGYALSGDGFIGSMIGLAIGAAIGGVLAGVIAGLQAAWRALNPEPKKAPQPAAKESSS